MSANRQRLVKSVNTVPLARLVTLCQYDLLKTERLLVLRLCSVKVLRSAYLRLLESVPVDYLGLSFLSTLLILAVSD